MFRQRQFRPDKVIFSGTHVRAGTHSVQYIATVATEGLFTLPPTKAYDVNQPELMGLSPGKLIDNCSGRVDRRLNWLFLVIRLIR